MYKATSEKHNICLHCAQHSDIMQNVLDMTKTKIKHVIPSEWL